MITKDQAMQLKYGDVLLHATEVNRDGTPLRCRVTGACKVWKTKPGHFRVPVKHGLRTSFYISSAGFADNCRFQCANNMSWSLPELWEIETALCMHEVSKVLSPA
jgi:hypothetical protein